MSTVAAAYGAFLMNQVPYFSALPALATPHGTLLKPGGRVAAYLRSTGVADGDDQFTNSAPLVTTLQQACAYCRSGKNDVIYVLPGHAENISTADQVTNLVAGTQIISAGRPGQSNNPTFTWTAAAATFLFDVADCSLVGLNLKFTGANTIASPFTISAQGCSILACDIDMGSGASNDSQNPITVATGADHVLISGNKMYCSGAADALIQAILVSGAVQAPLITSNYLAGPTTTTTKGLVHFSGAATNVWVAYNNIVNATADGVGMSIAGSTAVTGFFAYNNVSLNGTTATAASKAVLFSASVTSTATAIQNFCSDEASKLGVVSASGGAAT